MLDHPGSSRSFLMRRSMESASSGQDGGGKKGPDTPSGGGGEASPAAASVVFATGRYNDFVNSGEYLEYQGADVEMDTHPSVDIEGYPVGEAGSMMVDSLPFHARLMNTGTDQGTLLIASQSDTKSEQAGSIIRRTPEPADRPRPQRPGTVSRPTDLRRLRGLLAM